MAKRGRPKKVTTTIAMATAAPAPAQNGKPGQPDGETTSGYFRRQLKANSALLQTRSNSELLSRWLADNPGQTAVPPNVQKILANVKGILRKKARERGKPKTATEQVAHVAVAITTSEPTPVGKTASKSLETLEEQIDDCLTMARSVDADGLVDVIRALRSARNTVVWKLGQ